MAATGADTHEDSFSIEDCHAALCESIRRIRQHRKLTLGVVAQKMGVTESELERIENGETPPSFGLARSAAGALNCSFVQFSAYVESVLTGRLRAGIEVNIPYTASEESRMQAFADTYAALKDPDNRNALEIIIQSFVAKKAVQ